MTFRRFARAALLAVFLAAPAVALACPSTHYACGSASCCPR